MADKNIPMTVVTAPVAGGAAFVTVDQVGKLPQFKPKMRSDADLALAESSGTHLIPTSTPAKKFPDKPHYFVNEATSFSPATQKMFVHNEPTARVRVKFDPNASDVSGKSPGPVTFERLPTAPPQGTTSKPTIKKVARAPFEEEFPMSEMNPIPKPKRHVPREDLAGISDSGHLPQGSTWRQEKPGYVPQLQPKVARIPELVNVGEPPTPIKRRTFLDVTMDADYATPWPGSKKHGQHDRTYDSVKSNKITDETLVSNWERQVGMPKLSRQKRSTSSLKQDAIPTPTREMDISNPTTRYQRLLPETPHQTPHRPNLDVSQNKELRKIIKEVKKENATPLNEWRRRRFQEDAAEEQALQRLIKIEQPAEFKALEAAKPKDVVNPAYLTPPRPSAYVPLSGLDDVPRKHPQVPTKFDDDIAFEKALGNASPYNKPHHKYGRYHDKLENREFMSKEAISKRAKQFAKNVAIGVGVGLSAAGLGVGVGSVVGSKVQGASTDKKLRDLENTIKKYEEMKTSWSTPNPTIHQNHCTNKE